MAKKAALGLLVLFLVYFIVSKPAQAATVMKVAGAGIGYAAVGLGSFLAHLFTKERV